MSCRGHTHNRLLFYFLLLLVLPGTTMAQPSSIDDVRSLVLSFKKDERGPYQAIRWFCPDGTIRPATQPCGEPVGVQHALHKDIVQRLAKERGIYLGQILAGTKIDDFIDAASQNTRMKQYLMEKYLQTVDDGWINRRARYYRGAVQAEDEEAWGVDFLNTVASNEDIITSQFFLLRQISKDIPHQANDDRWTRIRADAKTIADSLPSFMPLRIKLHGQPEADDVQRIDTFLSRHRSSLDPSVAASIRALRNELDAAYQAASVQSLERYTPRLPDRLPITALLKQLISGEKTRSGASQDQYDEVRKRCERIAEILLMIRPTLLNVFDSTVRVTLLDLSNDLERLLFTEIGDWQSKTLRDLLARQYILVKAMTGCGFLDLWEWDRIESILRPPSEDRITVEQLVQKAEYGGRAVEWSAGMARAEYQPVITLFQTFEPLAGGFLDDRIRASILLRLGETAGALADLAKQSTGASNRVLSVSDPNRIRGLNPGFAVGTLQVVTGSSEGMTFTSDNIYVLENAPADMKPVAGILTVASGNLVSHVQLLARNLGIPNADIPQTLLHEFTAYDGQRVFYAVSPRGTVIMKPEAQMTPEEQSLIEVKSRSEEKIAVPVQKIDIQRQTLPTLREVRALDSGRICGPKAANLGELKRLFPNQVANGIVIPFGVFRRHMDQPMPGYAGTYWSFIQETFTQAEHSRTRGHGEATIEKAVIARLAQLRDAVKSMPLLESLRMRLGNRFLEAFGTEAGKIPVFIRSDTNMEDLKDFTGAGLNLTVFNVRDKEKIYQAIRDVWASPYSERSYRWRQKYLLNPENVYPSLLILPTIFVDKSGVMITSGVSNSDPRDLTVAFSRGPGGAVDGQAAESYLLRHTGDHLLLSPSRETQYTIMLDTGGVKKGFTRLVQPVLNEADLQQLRTIADAIREHLPGAPGIETEGPFDVELGFQGDKLWLFQVRPYVENKRARSSQYLQSMDPQTPKTRMVLLSEPINER